MSQHHHSSTAQESLRVSAYQKWEAAGKPAGDGVQFWLQAEKEAAHVAGATGVKHIEKTGHTRDKHRELETHAAQENAQALNASVDSHYRDNNRMFQTHGDRGHRHGVKGE